MSLLQEDEIKKIRKAYKKIKSIAKTAEETGHAKATVGKYVKDMSKLSKNSIYFKNPIMKINPKTNEKTEYDTISEASKITKISASNICHCLMGRTKQAGKFIWKYKKNT